MRLLLIGLAALGVLTATVGLTQAQAAPLVQRHGATALMAAQTDLDAAIAAERARWPDYALDGEGECAEAQPAEGARCLYVHSTSAEAQRGIVVLNLLEVGAGGHAEALGRGVDGTWGYWFASQQDTYHALRLPASMNVCADGEGLNVRTQPAADAALVGVLADGAIVSAEEFALTEPDGSAPGGARGDGWYRLSAPLGGWVKADYVSDAHLDGCGLRDFLVCSATAPAAACPQPR